MLGGELADRLGECREEGVDEVGDGDADRGVSAGAERGGQGVGDVVELPECRFDAFAGLG